MRADMVTRICWLQGNPAMTGDDFWKRLREDLPRAPVDELLKGGESPALKRHPKPLQKTDWSTETRSCMVRLRGCGLQPAPQTR
jgi:hypothetical protein